MKDLICQMLAIDPAQRISAIEALLHDYCIINKISYVSPKKKKLTFSIPSAEEFLSHYSLELNSQKRAAWDERSAAFSIKSGWLSNKVCSDPHMFSEFNRLDKVNSDSTNDVRVLDQSDFQSSFMSKLNAVIDGKESLVADPITITGLQSTLAKKSKFAL